MNQHAINFFEFFRKLLGSGPEKTKKDYLALSEPPREVTFDVVGENVWFESQEPGIKKGRVFPDKGFVAKFDGSVHYVAVGSAKVVAENDPLLGKQIDARIQIHKFWEYVKSGEIVVKGFVK